ncbi:MAG: Ig-like domain-containing protein [Gemmatimonadota bacterium]|nr:Ig-like domain-containing protein [Gemmatimonadota bacterium]
MKATYYRAATAALALGALTACDKRQNAAGGLDDFAPTIDLQVPSVNDSVDINQPMVVHLQARDNLSLKRVVLTVDGDAALDTTFTSATATFNQTYQVALAGVMSGSHVDVRAVATDGAGNRSETASASVIVFDLHSPVVTISAPISGSVFRAGDATTVTVQASDSSGVSWIGYHLIQLGQSGGVTVIQADSQSVASTPVSYQRAFPATIPLTLSPGNYFFRGFARDVSNNGGVSADMIQVTVQDPFKPGLEFISPAADSNITIGSQILASVRLTDNVGVKRLSIVGITTSGDPDLGVVDTVVRYDSVFAPVNVSNVPQQFRAGLTDTTVRRLLTPKNAADSTTGPLYLIARVTDVAGNDSTVVRAVRIVSGPSVRVLRPGAGAIAAPGKSLIVEVQATDRDGVRVLGYNVAGAFTTTRTAPTPANPPDTLVFIDTLAVPSGVTGTSFTIVPFATDDLGQPGSGPGVTVSVQSLANDTEGPLVYQTVRTRVEADDSVTIRATDPSGITSVGMIMTLESDGTQISRDSATSDGSFTDLQLPLGLNVPPQYVGQKIIIRSFAYDSRGNIGYSVAAGTSVTQGQLSGARPDTALVVYGRTFSLPSGGVVGDIAIDSIRARTYLSNISFDRIDVWEGGTEQWSTRSIAVGADPWGLFIGNGGNELIVANSGGTNISRVSLGGPGSAVPPSEDVTRRIKTPNTYIVQIEMAIDGSGLARIKRTLFDYSDRPQYVVQAINNDIYYSTKPTPSAPDGTIRRYLESSRTFGAPQPDVQQIWQYAAPGEPGKVAIINADVVNVYTGAQSVSDSLEICDHPLNMGGPLTCVRGVDPNALTEQLRSMINSDVVAANIEIKSLALTDTTFVAASGDRRWIAFGEAATEGAGRVMMVNGLTEYFSPGVNVRDLVHNASERVFGLALNNDGTSAAVHGQESYFFDIENPFHLRLQGKVNTFDDGAGIAFHPDNDANVSNPDTRIAFVASANGTIEIVDTFHYLSRGTLPVRANLYGPIRVSNRFPGDDPQVILKLFGLTTEGMIVIDVRASDIQSIP